MTWRRSSGSRSRRSPPTAARSRSLRRVRTTRPTATTRSLSCTTWRPWESACSSPGGVHDFAWRPDGGAIAYIASDTAPAPTERGNDAFEVGNDDYLTTAPPAPAHLWLVSLATGAASRLTQGDWSVATSLATSPISWSPDGRTIAFVRFATPHSGDTDQSAVWLVDAATGAARGLTGQTAREAAPLLSPDGALVAYTFPRDGDPANLDEVRVAPASGGEGRAVTRATACGPTAC